MKTKNVKNTGSIFLREVKAFALGAIMMLLVISLSNNMHPTSLQSESIEVSSVDNLGKEEGYALPVRLSLNNLINLKN